MQTVPKHWLDVWLWPLLKLTIEPFSKKRSHWWQWRHHNPNLIRNEFSITKDKRAQPRRGSTWQTFYQTNFGWQKAVICEPNDPQVKYQIGYLARESWFVDDNRYISQTFSEICTLILQGQSAMLIGPSDTTFFAIDAASGQPIELKKLTITLKSQLPTNVTLV